MFLQVAHPPSTSVTVGKCTGGANQLFAFVPEEAEGGHAPQSDAAGDQVYTVQYHGNARGDGEDSGDGQPQMCIEGAPPAPPACKTYTSMQSCPGGRCEWNATSSSCTDWTPPPEKCHVPNWPATYNMSLSTVAMPCDYEGFMSDGPHWPTIKEFGLISIDWSNARAKWAATDPMTCEEDLLKQAKVIQSAETLGPKKHRVFVYRNTVIAYPWMTSLRRVFNDPAYEVWFLKFKSGADGRSALHHDGDGTYHHPVCDHNFSPPKCSVLYHNSQTQTPGYPTGSGNCPGPCDCGRVPCGFYLFDQRQALTAVNGMTLREFLIHNVTVSDTGLLSPDVDGLYLDDYWSSSMHNGAGGSNDMDGTEVADVGLSGVDVADLESNWTTTIAAVKKAVLDNDGFTWQMMVNNGEGSGSAMWYRVNKGWGCAAQVRAACHPDSMEQTGALNYDLDSAVANGTMFLPDFDEHLASFLLIRGPYAWIGFGWIGCSQPYTKPLGLAADYGVPQGVCTETSTGVFERKWSKADIKLDCNTWEGTVTMHNKSS